VMAAVRAAGADLGAAGLALADMAGLAGRGARVDIAAGDGRALVIDESYNANPASMRATLAQLGLTAARRRIAVLGAMKELGDFGPGLHAGLAEPLAAAKVDYAILVGDEMSALADELGKSAARALGKAIPFAHCQTPAEAQQALADFGVQSGDAILVKGSNSVGLGSLVATLTGKQS
jgi:UDP-N-acetylmuramoyl-tripeptide--D-alanyl-D-alanine ligase